MKILSERILSALITHPHPILAFILLLLSHEIYSDDYYEARSVYDPNSRPFYDDRNFVTAEGSTDFSSSGPWEEWRSETGCSRTCGGGVASDGRACRSPQQSACVGPSRRFFSCNTHSCPSGTPDFRAEQCSAFDSVLFEGRYYEWIPYTKAPAKCELNCMPKGERFYFRHKRFADDGTECDNGHVCVAGECLPIGCDNRLGSSAREDKCRKCGGDGSDCKTIDGTFSDNNLQVGYNDILLIPAGATNIIIKEVTPSNNYLALRNTSSHYYLNGNWRIDFPRELNFAGSSWHYERKAPGFFAPESIKALGPTSEAIYVVVLYQENNPGIYYEYSIPQGVVLIESGEYAWEVGVWSDCNQRCGGGYKTRRVTCRQINSGQPVQNDLCDGTRLPPHSETCGNDPCPIGWQSTAWSQCNAECGSVGAQYRSVYCSQIVGGVPAVLDDSLCPEEMPQRARACQGPSVCPQWFIGEWGSCSVLCGSGVETRDVSCYLNTTGVITIHSDHQCGSDKPNTTRPCDLFPCEGLDWIFSNWTGCSGCGGREESRTVFCGSSKGAIYDESLCHDYRKPEDRRECNTTVQCQYGWYAREWSDCTAKCGPGHRTREVFCGEVTSSGISKVNDSKCEIEKKYNDTEECVGKEEVCGGEWFTGPWSACSKACGPGQMSRTILCLVGNESSPVSNCNADLIPNTLDDCEGDSCGSGAELVGEESGDSEEDCEYDDEEASSGENSKNTGSGSGIIPELLSGSGSGEMLSGDPIILSSTVSPTTSPPISITTDESISRRRRQVEYSGSGSGSGSDLDDDYPPVNVGEVDALDNNSSSSGSGQNEFIFSGSGSGENATESPTEFPLLEESTMSTIEPGSGTILPIESTTGTMSPMQESTEFSTISPVPESTESGTMIPMPESTESGTISPIDGSGSGSGTISPIDASGSGSGTMSPIEASGSGSGTLSPIEASGSGSGTISPIEASGSGSGTMSPTESSGSGSGTISPIESSGSGSGTMSPVEELNMGSGSGDNMTEAGSGGLSSGLKGVSGDGSGSGAIDMDKMTDFSGSGFEATTLVFDEMSGMGTSEAPELTTLSTKSRGMCKPRKTNCTTTKYGCCPNGKDPAKGPFGSGCKTPKTCQDTKYGCCPDGISPAKGKNKKCKEIECSKTLYGCCPDKKTSKTSNSEENCKMVEDPEEIKGATTKSPEDSVLCGTSKYKCCDDGVTPAHGPNKEGCCLSTEFGCCADNITPKQGYNGEGCGCMESPWKCCPDNVTASTPTGCGCKFSEHGCCEDGYTNATGAEYDGCPCSTFRAGCCDDGVTRAKGPNKEGCGCVFSPEGCCPDGKTPASNNGTNCGCESSEFGCCPDGVTSALAENFGGCGVEVVNPGEVCGLDRVRGSCRNFTVKWFFDMEYGGCSRFWWGGCEGNGNKFSSQDECKSTCVEPEGRDACLLPRVSGPCEGYYPSYYYDTQREICAPFIYGGCLGNNNRFSTRAECENRCLIDDRIDPCDTPITPGPCKGNYTRYAYNKEEGKCTEFTYGGCKASPNNFLTELECGHRCSKDGRTRAILDRCSAIPEIGPCNATLKRYAYDPYAALCVPFTYSGCGGNSNRFVSKFECSLVCSGKSESCYEPRSEGQCLDNSNAKQAMWYYDSNESRCLPFYYSGCGGTKNRFASRDECEMTCPAALLGDPTCSLPAVPGDCESYSERYYYDSYSAQCRPFVYSGCGANANNFFSLEECRGRCDRNVKHEEFERANCLLDRDQGSCNDQTTNWFYDTSDGVCKDFTYYGCGGNGNRFSSRDECDQKCRDVQDPCSLPRLVGPCSGNFKQFFYSSDYDTCFEFSYSGCMGNANRFDSLALCENRCKRGRDSGGETTTVALYEPDRVDPRPNLSGDPCTYPADTGPCRAAIPSIFYNADTQKCEEFTYGGCGGNWNRFDSTEQCERSCGEYKGREVCNEPSDIGPCRARLEKYYYSPSEGTCNVMYYGGCGGNGNRFSTRDECERTCARAREEERNPDEPSQTHTSNDNQQVICNLPVESGDCREEIKRYYYDSRARICSSFTYSGCGGNMNRFKTYISCMEFCFVRTNRELDAPQQKPIDYDEKSIAHVVEFDEKSIANIVDPYEIDEKSIAPREPDEIDEKSIALPREPDEIDEKSIARPRDPYEYDEKIIAVGPDPNEIDEKSIAIPRDPNEIDEKSIALPRDPNEIDEKSIALPRDPYKIDRVPSNNANCDTTACSTLVCPYGVQTELVDDCHVCTCYNPCRGLYCPEGSRCAIELRENQAVGYCVNVTGVRDRDREPVRPPGAPAEIIRPETSSTQLLVQEGTLATFECLARGLPEPKVTWQKDGSQISTNTGRYHRIGTNLQIVGAYSPDAGVYTCVASNPYGTARRDIELVVSESVPSPATLIPPPSLPPAILGKPYTIRCFALGFPRPQVTWFRKERMLPFSSEKYEQLRDYTLLLKLVSLRDLGIYTCQAYNGFGRGDSWEVVVKGVKSTGELGRGEGNMEEDEEEARPYLVESGGESESEGEKEGDVYDPPPRVVETVTESATIRGGVQEATTIQPDTHQQPQFVPLRTRIVLPITQYTIGSSFSMMCESEGYPPPTISWFKDDLELDNSRSNDPNVLAISNAQAEDGGTYQCVARNEHGTGQSYVDVTVQGPSLHPNCTDNPFFANCALIVRAQYCTNKYYARFCCKSCTIAGQLPTYGPHLSDINRAYFRKTGNEV